MADVTQKIEQKANGHVIVRHALENAAATLMIKPLHILTGIAVCISGAWTHALEIIGKPVVSASASAVVLEWRTDVECGTRAQLGTNPAQLNRKAEGAVSAQHRVVLEGLTPGTTYHYSLGSARTRLAEGSFSTPTDAASAKPSLTQKIIAALTPGSATPASPAPAVKPPQAPAARMTWGNLESLQDHFDRHGRDFQSRDPEHYAAQAWELLQRAKTGELPMKLDDSDGTLRVWIPRQAPSPPTIATAAQKLFFAPKIRPTGSVSRDG